MLDTLHVPPRAEGRALSVLALGVNWFRPGSGGLDRVYADLMAALPAAGVATSGLVLGPPDVAELTGGRVQAFGRPGASLPERLWRARALAGGLAASGRFDLVAAHFALFALPALDRLRGLPLVVHFHGPWAEESAQEGAGGLSVAAKRAMERLRAGPTLDPRLASLSDQERRILDLIALGKTNRQIAEEMYLAEKTVKNYVSNLLAKLGMARRTEAAVFAVKHANDPRRS